jgi:type II secretory pathway pseudopilin PulG
MLKLSTAHWLRGEQGDTLIEVTFALTILGAVLIGSTATVALAFRTGQTANERTEVAEAAQSQMEALRSFRDNHTWPEFQAGLNCGTGGYCGVNSALAAVTATCATATHHCFHMELLPTSASTTEWIPVAGPMTTITPNTDSILTVPTTAMEITSPSPVADQGCGYDFTLDYSFQPPGGSVTDTGDVATELVNLQLPVGGGPCP